MRVQRGSGRRALLRARTTLGAYALAAASACADARTSSSLERSMPDGGDALQLEAAWRYRSAKVDVDIDLLTVEGPESCATTARLRVDEALAGTDVYRLPETDCAQLRLSHGGDLVLLDSPTGHDWSAEAIDVDSEHESIRLGPWHDDVSGISYRFTLSSPECKDDSSCECPKLERHADDQVTSLELARTCD